ncbi:hypothetical protein OG455_09665 [Kitasatospora sp. NBC_01287]|uniref:hypothetical protein n=1 Tax=Kitasatospora sp. NBC_01287 TaxID=2903573 RepID=UPI0022548E5E|nr:hypothetical protein [Kitasatospora sp. NBC_01287]MCX4745787.1 hypothetical protein [Kitasatospora sp. NBC_01287]
MRKLIAAIALTTTVAAAGTTAGTAAASAAPLPAPDATGRMSLRGWALLNEHGPGPNPGERLTARVDARTTDGRTRGHATVTHVFDNEGSVRVEISVDCLTADGSATVVTGSVDSATFTVPAGRPPLPPEPSTWHPEAALTFYPADANGERRVGWSIASTADPAVPPSVTKCAPTAPDLWTVQGGFALRR